LALVVAAAWLVVTARQTEASLTEARAEGLELQGAIVAGDDEAAAQHLASVQRFMARVVAT
jgi:hypothetical protein